MDGLATFMLDVFANADGAWAQAEAVAWYHAEFLRLRPFVQGNHLLALVVAGAQMEILFGGLRRSSVDVAAYEAAMAQVNRRVTLRPLTRWFHELSGACETLAFVRAARPRPLYRQWRRRTR